MRVRERKLSTKPYGYHVYGLDGGLDHSGEDPVTVWF